MMSKWPAINVIPRSNCTTSFECQAIVQWWRNDLSTVGLMSKYCRSLNCTTFFDCRSSGDLMSNGLLKFFFDVEMMSKFETLRQVSNVKQVIKWYRNDGLFDIFDVKRRMFDIFWRLSKCRNDVKIISKGYPQSKWCLKSNVVLNVLHFCLEQSTRMKFNAPWSEHFKFGKIWRKKIIAYERNFVQRRTFPILSDLCTWQHWNKEKARSFLSCLKFVKWSQHLHMSRFILFSHSLFIRGVLVKTLAVSNQ